MANGRASVRLQDENLFLQKDHLVKISAKLTGGIGEVESTILNSKKDARKIGQIKKIYEDRLSSIVNELKILSTEIFREINIEDVVSNVQKGVPETYQAYINATENLTTTIAHDMLTKKDWAHALVAAERWVMVSRMCYESSDFLSSGLIIFALSSSEMTQLKLVDELSEHSQALINHFKLFYSKSDQIQAVQNRHLNYGEAVIPFLHALPNLLERVEAAGKRSAKRNRKNLRKSYTGYQSILELGKKTRLGVEQALYKNNIGIDYGVEIQILSASSSHKTLKSSLIMDRLKIYGDFEKFLLEQSRLLEYGRKKQLMGSENNFLLKIRPILSNWGLSEEKRLLLLTVYLRRFKDLISTPLKKQTGKVINALTELIAVKPDQLIISALETPTHEQVTRKLSRKRLLRQKECEAKSTPGRRLITKRASEEDLEKLRRPRKRRRSRECELKRHSVSFSRKNRMMVEEKESTADKQNTNAVEVPALNISERVETKEAIPQTDSRQELRRVESAQLVTKRRKIFESLGQANTARHSPRVRALVSSRHLGIFEPSQPSSPLERSNTQSLLTKR